jgi:phage portal protein BeeE
MAWSAPSWREFSGGVLRALGYRWEEPMQLPTGAATSSPQSATFAVPAAMSAWSEFPWVRSCVTAIGEDLSGLPLRLTRGSGANAEVIDRHPLLDLFSVPTTDQDRVMWETQLWTYLLPVGWVVVLHVGPPKAPTSLKLLHPERCRLVSDTTGTFEGVEYQPIAGGVRHFGAEAVTLIRMPSWRSGDMEQMGEGAISALKAGLNSEHAAAEMAAKGAKRGRPDVVLSPASESLTLTKPQREEIAREYGVFAESGKAALVLSSHIKAEFQGWTPRDLEFKDQRLLTRDEVLAVFSVPPTRVGLPTANYATAQQQDAIYWQTLRAKAARLDHALTRIARWVDPQFTVSHDFSGVAALQESRDARLQRVTSWVLLGADPAAAAAYEGFQDAPLQEQPAAPATPAADPAATKGLVHLFRAAPEDLADPPALMVPTDPVERATVWKSWVDGIHTPAELKLARSTRAALVAQRNRVVARIVGSPVSMREASGVIKRDLVSSLMALLFPAEEDAQFAAAIRDALADTISAGYKSGAGQLGKRWSIDSGRADVLTQRRLGTLVSQTSPTTQAQIGQAVADGIAAGEGVNEIAARISASPAFAPSRALLIARTETTRSLSAGHTAAYAEYADTEGVHVRKQWLSARDGEVRDAHQILDGQVRAVGEAFVIEHGEHAGAKADGPGEFHEPALVCNCRCTTVPIVEAA